MNIKFKKLRKRVILVLLTVILVFILFQNFTFLQVQGNSMYDTLQSGQFILIDKRKERTKEIKGGDIIVFRYSYENESLNYIKRVVAVEGDVISSKNKKLCVNNVTIENCEYTSKNKIKLQKNEFFVVGDNYSASIDSRMFGVISSDSIIGVVSNIL